MEQVARFVCLDSTLMMARCVRIALLTHTRELLGNVSVNLADLGFKQTPLELARLGASFASQASFLMMILLARLATVAKSHWDLDRPSVPLVGAVFKQTAQRRAVRNAYREHFQTGKEAASLVV